MIPVEQSPLERRARHLSRVGGQTGPCLRFVLGLLDQSRADLAAARSEIDRLEALTLEQARRRDLGVRS